MDNKNQAFQPFDRVLVRDENSEPWHINYFSYYTLSRGDGKTRYRCLDTSYAQCIPFEGNESLLGIAEKAE